MQPGTQKNHQKNRQNRKKSFKHDNQISLAGIMRSLCAVHAPCMMLSRATDVQKILFG